jgi:two-component system CheB/CheR fusion protein
MEQLNKQYQVQIFATDLSNQAIERARIGLYPEGIAIDVSPARLERFFVKEDKSYRIKKEIRDMVVFAQQNLLTDPPFTKIDLLSCRNLLIYLNTEVQRRLVPLFHYVLSRGGILVLGSSETTGGFSELFVPLSSKWKIFRRKETATAPPALVEFPLRTDKETRKSAAAGLATTTGPAPLSDLVGKMLVQRFAPPSVIITDSGDIVYIHGLTGLFLQPAPGLPSNNIFTMAREGLRMDLTAAVRCAATQDTPVIQKGMVTLAATSGRQCL